MSLPDAPTLGALLDRTALDLRPVAGLDATARERRVRGVHSSDLADPTPFLAEELVLLTTGTQFLAAAEETAPYDDYVARLVARGVSALGFGTEVVRAGVPEPLAAACLERGLPLFEVPYRTPFIAVARANAQDVAAEEYARRSWALGAQRALSLAALRTDGLNATLDELSRQLGGWVGLFDAAGTLGHAHPASALGERTAQQLHGEVAALLRRGVRAASAIEIDGRAFHVQTLGRGGHLRGALAVAADSLDREARGVVTTVVAMAGLALEQRHGLSRSVAALRAGLAATLLGGDTATPPRIARAMWGGFPTGEVAFAVTEPLTGHGDAVPWLEEIAAATHGGVFFGEIDDGLLVVAAAADPVFDELAARAGIRLGVSAPADLAQAATALAQARVARDRGGAGAGAS